MLSDILPSNRSFDFLKLSFHGGYTRAFLGCNCGCNWELGSYLPPDRLPPLPLQEVICDSRDVLDRFPKPGIRLSVQPEGIP